MFRCYHDGFFFCHLLWHCIYPAKPFRRSCWNIAPRARAWLRAAFEGVISSYKDSFHN